MQEAAHTAHEAAIHTVTYLRWIPLLPLIGAVINGIGGYWIQKSAGKNVVGAIACAMPLLGFVLAVRAFLQLMGLDASERLLLDSVFPWIHVGNLAVDVAFQIDPLSSVMILIITGVGGLIHIYSTAYMHEEPAFWRFFAYLNLFTFAMLTLVMGDNLLLMFVGWEGVGLCSYALIGFWYSEWANASAGSKAFIVNRVGDFGFMCATFLLFWSLAEAGHPTLLFREIAQHAPLLENHVFWGMGTVTLITMLMFVGATGKSAQIPLYVWLPDAMAGPTPVSALIHAATMVTAGVYMIARLSVLFDMAPTTGAVIASVGAATAFFAATIGTTQFDIKKVLAYSTVSQLGFMFIAMGVGAYATGVFHLMTHAFFKACLFLGSGSVIHAMHHEQDMRKMGGLKKWMPYTYATYLLSTLAIAGIPPFSGFFSKDEILWKAFSSGHRIVWFVAVCAAAMTAFYMFRSVYMTFHGESRADEHTKHHLHESPLAMTIPLMVLAALATFSGFLNVPHALFGDARFDAWLAPVVQHGDHGAHGAHGGGHHVEVIEYVLMALSVAVAAAGIWVARAMYETGTMKPDRLVYAFGGKLYRTVYNKYYVDEAYDATVIAGTMGMTRVSAWFDTNIVDGIVNGSAWVVRMLSQLYGLFDHYVVDGAVNGVAVVTSVIGSRVRRLQTGHINAYLYVVVLAVVGMMVARIW